MLEQSTTPTNLLPRKEKESEEMKTKRKRESSLDRSDQKGRHKINSQINELKKLLPECKYAATTKASILECAAVSIKRMRMSNYELELFNRKVAEELMRMQYQLNKMREEGVPLMSQSLDQPYLLNENLDNSNWKPMPMYSTTTTSFTNTYELMRLQQLNQLSQYNQLIQPSMNNTLFISPTPYAFNNNDFWTYTQGIIPQQIQPLSQQQLQQQQNSFLGANPPSSYYKRQISNFTPQ